MKNFIVVFLIAFSLFSCNKNKQTTKKIDGNWELISYKITNYEGLIEYGSGEGLWTFESEAPFTEVYPYSFTYSCQFPSGLKSGAMKGTFKVVSKGEFIDFTVEDSIGVTVKTHNYRIITQTSDDLELEYLDEERVRHNYVLKKVRD
jgi:hypothetical protein